MSLLEVSDLAVEVVGGPTLVRGVAFDVADGEVVGIVGESGSGKTMTALSLLGLLPQGVRVAAGIASLAGRPLLGGEREGDRPDATMIFQNPTAALNPTMRVGTQLARLLRLLDRRSGRRDPARARPEKAAELLGEVGIHEPRDVLRRYPHQLSGGMNQRVMIAMALAAQPRLLIADEPTTGLDVTVQARILELIRTAVAARGIGALLVSHDMGVIAQTCQRVVVMRDGEVCETAPVAELFHAPRHPYTAELLAAARDERREGGHGAAAG